MTLCLTFQIFHNILQHSIGISVYLSVRVQADVDGSLKLTGGTMLSGKTLLGLGKLLAGTSVSMF